MIFDVDSTLSRIEGIEWLARLRGPEVFARVNEITERAMRGELEFNGVYAERLNVVLPTKSEVDALGAAYIENISTGVSEAVERLCASGVKLVIVSGGILQPVLHLAAHLGIGPAQVHAVRMLFDKKGEYAGYDQENPCARQMGKRTVISSLKLDRPALLIGDGMTDAEAKPAVDAFAAYTGAVRRENIVALADFELASFSRLFDHITA